MLVTARHRREHQQRDDVGDLDHRVHGGARRVLVGVADGVAGDGGLVGVRTLLVNDAVLVAEAVLERLLGVVPRAAARGHRDGDEEAGDDHAQQHGADSREGLADGGGLVEADGGADAPDDEEQHDRRQDRQQRGHDHFLDRGLGQHVDGAAVIRLGRVIHDALDLAELTTDFFDHRLRSATHGHHRHAAEEERQQAAEQEADDDVGVRKREVSLDARKQRARRRVLREVLEVGREGGEQHQRAETGRADRVALGDGFRRVADGVERVGGFTDRVVETRHFGDAAGVVGDRAEGVERHNHAGERQHRGDGDADADEASSGVGEDDAADDDQGRNRARFERDGETLDHVGAVTGDRGLRDRADRTIADAGVVFGDPDDEAGDDEAGNTAPEQVHDGDGRAHRVGHGDRWVIGSPSAR